MKKTNRLMWKWTGCLTLMLAVIFVAGCKPARDESSDTPDAGTPAPPPAQAAAPAVAVAAPVANPVAVTPPVRIKCGATNQVTDSEGKVWLVDQGSADGQTYEVADAEVANTKDPALFRTERYSMTAYKFTVPNGKYTVKLLFAEVYTGITGPGDRVFSFDVGGREFKDFDIWVKAGGANKAYIQSVDVDVTSGQLNITFTPKVENPKVCGIEILPRT